jgi:23S rRNA (cytosine1962-C5)-methyltransferase
MPPKPGQRPARPKRTPRPQLPLEPIDSPESPWVQLRNASRNPLIYKRMIGTQDKLVQPGDVVQVYDRQGAFFGRGLYNPRSEIVIRMLTLADETVDDAFWQSRLAAATTLRRRLQLADDSDAYRLVHAEGDGLSGLIVERYADVLVFEFFSLGMAQRAELLAKHLQASLGLPTILDRPEDRPPEWRVYHRVDERIAQFEGIKISEQPEIRPVTIREHGVRYRVDIAAGHKTGFFCDQRENRRKLATLCTDAEVLDMCCYTGGFSLNAKLRGNAAEVTGVDLDEEAIALARKNTDLNQTRINFVHADAFAYLRQMRTNGRQFDVVILDPPKFAPNRASLEEALEKYHDLNVLGMSVVRPGGILLTCSCSGLVDESAFLDVIQRAGRRVDRTVQLIEKSGAAPDHPIALDCPESGYLKANWLRVK